MTTTSVSASDLVISDVVSDGDWDEATTVIAEGFADPLEDTGVWIGGVREHSVVRIARRQGRAVGAYILLPLMQYHGGVAVPAMGVAAVAVVPDARRSGVAGALMTDLPEVARGHGGAVAPLWAATTRLYRRWGWEVCGRGKTRKVNPRALSGLRADGSLVRDVDSSVLSELASRDAVAYDSAVVRPSWWFDQPIFPKPSHAYRFGWMENGRITGFMCMRQGDGDNHSIATTISAFITTTPDSLAGLLGTAGATESLSNEIKFQNAALAPLDDLHYLLPEPHRDIEIITRLNWMQRIVDVDAALGARGYAPGVNATVHLEISDPTERVRPVVLEVAGGRGSVSNGGQAKVRLDSGTLAAWYSGALTMTQARRLGRIDAADADIETLDSILARRPVWIAADFLGPKQQIPRV